MLCVTTYVTHETRWNTRDHGQFRNIAGNNRTSGNHGAATDRYAGQDNRTASNPNIVADSNRLVCHNRASPVETRQVDRMPLRCQDSMRRNRNTVAKS